MFVNGFFRELHPHPCRRGLSIVDGVGARTSHRTRKTKAGEEATSILIFLKSSTRPTRKVKSVPELSVMPQLLLLRAGEIQSKVRFNCHKLELKLFFASLLNAISIHEARENAHRRLTEGLAASKARSVSREKVLF